MNAKLDIPKQITAESSPPIPGLRLRPMARADIPAVIAIEQASYPFSWSEGIFRDCLRAGYVCRIAEFRGELAAYAVMSTGAGEAHVLNVCVRLDFRDQGIGRFMMHWLIDHARVEHVGDIFLEVRPSNPAAIHLYESIGFVRVGLRKGYYQASRGREDALVYKLTL